MIRGERQKNSTLPDYRMADITSAILCYVIPSIMVILVHFKSRKADVYTCTYTSTYDLWRPAIMIYWQILSLVQTNLCCPNSLKRCLLNTQKHHKSVIFNDAILYILVFFVSEKANQLPKFTINKSINEFIVIILSSQIPNAFYLVN